METFDLSVENDAMLFISNLDNIHNDGKLLLLPKTRCLQVASVLVASLLSFACFVGAVALAELEEETNCCTTLTNLAYHRW